MSNEFASTLDHQAIAEAIAHQNAIDRDEAGPKAIHGAVSYRGVIVDSRWDVSSEYREMRAFVNNMPDLTRARIQSIWCDSKYTANYIITVKPGRFNLNIAADIEEAVITAIGGHNGIMIQGDTAEDFITLECNWGEGPEQ